MTETHAYRIASALAEVTTVMVQYYNLQHNKSTAGNDKIIHSSITNIVTQKTY